MDYLEEKMGLLSKALRSWGKILDEPYSEIVRDAAIQRYEFSYELLWKCVKIFLKEREGVDCNSPKSCFRALKGVLKLSEEDNFKDVVTAALNVDGDSDSIAAMAGSLCGALNGYSAIPKKYVEKLNCKDKLNSYFQ